MKGRKTEGRYAGLPHSVMNHRDYIQLPPNAIRLLLELARQYNGYNNGALGASWKVMKTRGFRSQTTLHEALKVLTQSNFIMRTREGFFSNPGKQCALYAVTWQAIDECPTKRLDVRATDRPPRNFALESRGLLPIQKLEPIVPDSVAMCRRTTPPIRAFAAATTKMLPPEADEPKLSVIPPVSEEPWTAVPDIKQIRYENTRLLVRLEGRMAQFALRIGKKPPQTTNFAGENPRRPIGNKVAREIEEAYGLAHGQLDHHWGGALPSKVLPLPSPRSTPPPIQSRLLIRQS